MRNFRVFQTILHLIRKRRPCHLIKRGFIVPIERFHLVVLRTCESSLMESIRAAWARGWVQKQIEISRYRLYFFMFLTLTEKRVRTVAWSIILTGSYRYHWTRQFNFILVQVWNFIRTFIEQSNKLVREISRGSGSNVADKFGTQFEDCLQRWTNDTRRVCEKVQRSIDSDIKSINNWGTNRCDHSVCRRRMLY